MKYKKLLLAGVCVFFVVSCESSTYSEVSSEAEIANPTYLANVKPIIFENCLSCHSAGGGQAPYLETKDQLKDAIVNFGLLNQINAPSGLGMPLSGRMPQSKIDVIVRWSASNFTN